MGGYTDSQTWGAWLESWDVGWTNTSLGYLVCVALAAVTVVATWFRLLPVQGQDTLRAGQGATSLCQEQDDTPEKPPSQQTEAVDEDPSHTLDDSPVMQAAQRRLLEESLKKGMSEEQLAAEREARAQQLAVIHHMMQEQHEKFGQTTFDDIKNQMKLYCD